LPEARDSTPYGVRDVERLLRLPRSTIRSLIGAGFVTPVRGARGAWRFSFRDLIVLRTAQALVDAHVPTRRITRSMRALRRRLPPEMPLSGLAIGAAGDRVVVRERGGRWQAESGQYVLEFGVDQASGSINVIERRDETSAQEWFDRAVALEATDKMAALKAYEQAITADTSQVDAYVNCGRLLHDTGHLRNAERVYRAGVKACGEDCVLLYNLAVLLDDMKRPADALAAYESALRADPDFADGHYNVALLYERLRRPKEALRHMARYRALVGK
jgi:tetratricopeptide (TPR) repeat protein